MGGSYMQNTTCADAAVPPAIDSTAAIIAAGKILVSFISVLRSEPVTDPTNGVYEPWLTPSLQLLSNARDVHLERVRFRSRVLRPDRFRQLGVCDEAAAVAHERRQDPELDAGQPQRPAAALSSAFAEVERDVADGQARAPVAAMAADDRLHPRHQHLEREGLGDIIVGAELEPGDPIAHGGLGADADESGVGFGPKLLEELGSIVVWKHEVEEDDIGIPLPDELQAAVGGVDRTHRVAFLAQAGRDRPRKAAIVLDQRNLPADRHMECGRNSGTEHALLPPPIPSDCYRCMRPGGGALRNGTTWQAVQWKVVGAP